MNWRDFLYFSKGERRALIILLLLIVSAWLTLMLIDKDHKDEVVVQGTLLSSSDSINQPQSYPDTILPRQQEKETRKISSLIVREKPLQTNKRYSSSSSRIEKFKPGTIVELNTADTTILKKVPGIGSAFSNRIIKYRALLGGFYSVGQLGEVYGIDADRYVALEPWFVANPELISRRSINSLPADSLYRHPYISSHQARAIIKLRQQKGSLSGWDNLILLDEFTTEDIERISYYFSFE